MTEPATESSLYNELFQDIQPPSLDQIKARGRARAIWGFPLTAQWFEFRYDLFCEDRPEPESGTDPDPLVADMISFQRRLSKSMSAVCRGIYTDGVIPRMTSALHQTGRVDFFIIGRPGKYPSPEIIEKLADAMWEWGVVEKPGWFTDYYD